MIVHYSFFAWRAELSRATLAALRDDFAALAKVIPEIRGFRWVVNNSTEGLDRGFGEGIRVEFDDAAARQRYLEHPAHVTFAADRVIPALRDGLGSVLVFDYDER